LLADSQQLELREKKKAKLAKVAEVRAVRDWYSTRAQNTFCPGKCQCL
jgi:hypothetical protein